MRATHGSRGSKATRTPRRERSRCASFEPARWGAVGSVSSFPPRPCLFPPAAPPPTSPPTALRTVSPPRPPAFPPVSAPATPVFAPTLVQLTALFAGSWLEPHEARIELVTATTKKRIPCEPYHLHVPSAARLGGKGTNDATAADTAPLLSRAHYRSRRATVDSKA